MPKFTKSKKRTIPLRKVVLVPRPKRPPKPKPPGPMTLTLAIRHSINAQVYGPGTVTVPHEIALGLLSAEHRAMEDELRFSNTRPSARVIMGSPGRFKGYPVGTTLELSAMTSPGGLPVAATF
jgi:hypothetical protein